MTPEYQFIKQEITAIICEVVKNGRLIRTLLGHIAATIGEGRTLTFEKPYLVACTFEEILKQLRLLECIFEATISEPKIVPISQEEILKLKEFEQKIFFDGDLIDLIELLSEASISLLDLVREPDIGAIEATYENIKTLDKFEYALEVIDAYLEINEVELK